MTTTMNGSGLLETTTSIPLKRTMVWKDTRSAFALNNRSAHTQRHRLVCPFRPSASRPPVYFGSCSGHFLGAGAAH
jgi:hypothetical protein